MNSMKAPKILPAIARRAGISDELALKLWRRAVSEAEYLTGKTEGSEFWGLTVERFLAIVDGEVGQAAEPGLMAAPKLSWVWRHQTRMSQLSMAVAENAYRFWQNSWGSFSKPSQAA